MGGFAEFYEKFKAENLAFQEGLERRLLEARNITAEAGVGMSADAVVRVRMNGDFCITGLQIHPKAWEDEAYTEERLAEAVQEAYNDARGTVFGNGVRAVLDHFGL